MPRHALHALLPAVAVTLAACSDTTAPSAPAFHPAPAAAPSAALAPSPFEEVTYRIATTTGDLVMGFWQNHTGGPNTMARVDFNQSGIVTSAIDNYQNDLDPTIGVIRVRLQRAASYTGCIARMHPQYRFAESARCRTAVQAATLNTTSLGTFTVRTVPGIQLQLLSTTLDAFGDKLLLDGVGATFTFTNAATGAATTVVNNGIGDLVGYKTTIVTFVEPGTYTICETVAPKGHHLPKPACFTRLIDFGTPVSNDIVHAPLTIQKPIGGR